MRKSRTIICIILVIISLSACASTKVKNYSAALAIKSADLNTQIEQLTKNQRDLYASKDRYNKFLKYAILETENENLLTLNVWKALNTEQHQLDLFDKARTNSDSALERTVAIQELSKDIMKNDAESKGQRSEFLSTASKTLISLSAESPISDNLKFYSDFAKSTMESIKKANEDAKESTKNTSKEIDKKTENKQTTN